MGVHECQYNGTTIDGVGVTEVGNPCAALAIDRAVAPRQRNRQTSARSDLPVDPDHEVVEETFVSFFANNIIGLVRSTTSAPSHAAVGAWLNVVAPPRFAGADARWHVVPIIDPDKYREIVEANEVTSVVFAMKPEDLPAGRQAGTRYRPANSGSRIRLRPSNRGENLHRKISRK